MLTSYIGADGILDIQLGELGLSDPLRQADAAATLQTFIEALEKQASSANVIGIVLRGGAGRWLSEPSAEDWLTLSTATAPAQLRQRLLQRSKLLRRIETLAKPVAYVIDGTCLDLELEIALACHYRIATDSTAVRMGLPLVRRGVPPSAGASQRLPRISGITAALPLILQGDTYDAATAQQLGIVSTVAGATKVDELARAWLIGHPGCQAPWDTKGYQVPGGTGALAPHAASNFSIGVAKARKASNDLLPLEQSMLSAVYEGTQLPIDIALDVEVQCAVLTLSAPTTGNLIRSLWYNQDLARALIRRPANVSAQPVRKLAVLGAGLMGAGIAQVAAQAGLHVVLVDTSETTMQAAHAKIIKSLERSHPQQAAAIGARIKATVDLSELQGSDYVIEAIFENREAKAALMHKADQAMPQRPAHFIWASNTSTIPIDSLAAFWPVPEQVIGMHFFSPVPRMPLLEVIAGARTDKATLARSLDLAKLLGKTPILVNDSPGFYTSRIFCAYIDEGMAMLQEGIAPALIENAAKQAGFATSPLAVTDEVSLDLQALVINQAIQDHLPERFLRTHAQAVVARMNALQRLGRKSGGGFYNYPADGNKRLWAGLSQEFPLAPMQPDVQTVMQRLLCIEALESVRCLAEGVLTAAADGDLGSILGLGFPSWTGGTLSYIDTIGIDNFVAQCDKLASQHGDRFRANDWLRARAVKQERFHG